MALLLDDLLETGAHIVDIYPTLTSNQKERFKKILHGLPSFRVEKLQSSENHFDLFTCLPCLQCPYTIWLQSKMINAHPIVGFSKFLLRL